MAQRRANVVCYFHAILRFLYMNLKSGIPPAVIASCISSHIRS
jgi:hypothetical protein